jgi:hypothetical protein
VIKHIVVWRFKDEALGAGKAENLARARAAIESLRELVPQVRHLEVGVDIRADHDPADLVIYSEFDTVEDLRAYQVHPEHVRVAQLVGEMRETRAVVDYEV